MQRVAWTDERLDDLSRRMDAGFARVDRDIRDLRSDMNRGFATARFELQSQIGTSSSELQSQIGREIGTVRGEIGTVRGEIGTVRGEIGTLRGEIGELRTLIWRFNGGIIAAVVVSILLHGV